VHVAGLLTTINREAGRVSMHAVRERLLEEQAAALGLPFIKVPLPSPCSNGEYERAVREAIEMAKAQGITTIAFGDLFLEDVRRYREERMAPTGIEPIFPLWMTDTSQLAREMVTAGLRAHVTCVDPQQLDPSFAGRTFDARLLDDLPAGVDPCGEGGEFHTFVYAGPMFTEPLRVRPGPVVRRDGFVFADLMLADWPQPEAEGAGNGSATPPDRLA
jgi:uncharacterized protein (TIGR00290 family)